MTFFETIIVILVIGFVGLIVAYATIDKIFNERKKESDRAIQTIGAVSEHVSKSIAKVFEDIKEE